jgi:hypothetical protein
VGFYFRNVTELLLFGMRGKNARTLPPGRSQENLIAAQKREHSRKPDEQYALIEACSPGPRLELFARGPRPGWTVWGNEAEDYAPTWASYANHAQAARVVPLRRRGGLARASPLSGAPARAKARTCRTTPSAISSASQPGAKATGRPSAASSTAARPASR